MKARPGDLLVINRMWQKWWDINSGIRFQGDRGFNRAFSLILSLSHTEWSQAPCFELPYGKDHMLRNWERPLVNSCKALRPSVEQTTKNWVLPTTQNHVGEHGRSSCPTEPSDRSMYKDMRAIYMYIWIYRFTRTYIFDTFIWHIYHVYMYIFNIYIIHIYVK